MVATSVSYQLGSHMMVLGQNYFGWRMFIGTTLLSIKHHFNMFLLHHVTSHLLLTARTVFYKFSVSEGAALSHEPNPIGNLCRTRRSGSLMCSQQICSMRLPCRYGLKFQRQVGKEKWIL